MVAAPVQESIGCKTLCELCQKRGYDFCANAAKTTPITTPPAAPVQEPEHIVHSNGRYSPLLTRMMNKRVESNVKQVIHLYDEPPAAQPSPVQEPVAWIWKYANGEEEVVFVPPRHVDATHVDAPSTITPLYTTPPAAQRQWVWMTDEDIEQEFGFIDELLRDCVQRTEAKVREKNT
jgi:hypothetical protein